MKVILLEVALVASASAAISDHDMYMSTQQNWTRPQKLDHENKVYYDWQAQKNAMPNGQPSNHDLSALDSNFGKGTSRYRSNKSERRREKQNRQQPQIGYDDRVGYYWMNLSAVESEEENRLSQDDINKSLVSP